jgi:DNA-binding PadR family transcriptional regulator
MRFHYETDDQDRGGNECGPGRGRRGFRFGPRGLHIDFGGGFGDGFGDSFGPGRGGGGGGRRGRRRMFESGELRLVLLKLVADEPRHGYQLIKAIEDLTEGEYAPSPGVVYPTLTLLDDMGLIAEKQSPDSKKVFEATEEGRAHLADNEAEVDELIERLDGHGKKSRRGQRPEIGRAIGNLMTALRNRVAHDGWNEALLEEVIDILDDAAQRIERAKSTDKES